MFYAESILSKKGSLSKIWLAAHWDKKLSKQEVYKTDIADSVLHIKQGGAAGEHDRIPVSLRLSGHLLLGLVKIYQRKTQYLYSDCSDAMLKIKMAFRPGVVDLPAESAGAGAGAVAVSEFEMMHDADDFDAIEPQLDEWMQTTLSAQHVSRSVDITLEITPRLRGAPGSGSAVSSTTSSALALQQQAARLRAQGGARAEEDEADDKEEWVPFEFDEPLGAGGAGTPSVHSQASSVDVEVAREGSARRSSVAALDSSALLKQQAAKASSVASGASVSELETSHVSLTAREAVARQSLLDLGAQAAAEAQAARLSAGDLDVRLDDEDEVAFHPQDEEEEEQQQQQQQDQEQEQEPVVHTTTTVLEPELGKAASKAKKAKKKARVEEAEEEQEEQGELERKSKKVKRARKAATGEAGAARAQAVALDTVVTLTLKQLQADPSTLAVARPSLRELARAAQRAEAAEDGPLQSRLLRFAEPEQAPLSGAARLEALERAVHRSSIFGLHKAYGKLFAGHCKRTLPYAAADAVQGAEQEEEEDLEVEGARESVAAKRAAKRASEPRLASKQRAEVGELEAQPNAPHEDEDEPAYFAADDEEDRGFSPVASERSARKSEALKGPAAEDTDVAMADTKEHESPSASGSKKRARARVEAEAEAQARQRERAAEDDDESSEDEEQQAEEIAPAGGPEVGTEKNWHRRTVKMMKLCTALLETEDEVTYQSLAEGKKRRIVAGCFFEILQLKTWDRIHLTQERPYGDIVMSRGPKFDDPVPSAAT
jgi:hypothetical protein